MRIAILKPHPYKSKDGLGILGGVTSLFRNHLLPSMEKLAGVKWTVVENRKQLQETGGSTLLIPAINDWTASPQCLEVVKTAKQRRMRVATILHGDAYLDRLMKQKNCQELASMIGRFAYIGRDQDYPKKHVGVKAIPVVHPYVPVYDFDSLSKQEYREKKFASWSRVATWKGTWVIPKIMPKGENCHIFTKVDGAAYWYFKKLSARKLRFEKPLKNRIDLLRLESYQYGADCSFPSEYEKGRSQYTTLEMFEMGLVPIVFEGWNYGYKGIFLPNPTWIVKRGREVAQPNIKQCAETVLDYVSGFVAKARQRIVNFNRRFLEVHHAPKRVLKNWMKLIGG